MKYKEDPEHISVWATLSSVPGTCAVCGASPQQLAPGGVFSEPNLGLME